MSQYAGLQKHHKVIISASVRSHRPINGTPWDSVGYRMGSHGTNETPNDIPRVALGISNNVTDTPTQEAVT